MAAWTTLLLLSAVPLAAQALPQEDPAPGTDREPTCARIAVTSPQQPREGRGFSATRILGLEFVAAVHERYLSADHLLELKLYTPSDHLYQVLSVPFTVTPASPDDPARAVALEGRRRPERVRRTAQMEEAEGIRHVVRGAIPVAGSWIVTNSLYGRWRVDAHLDGATARCGTRWFRLEP